MSNSQFNRPYKRQISEGNYPVCYLCGKEITKVDEFSMDHILPKSKGGPTEPHNLAPAHKVCNNRRGNMPLSMWLCGIRKSHNR